MLDHAPASALRLTDRKTLLRYLGKLDDADPSVRATAALAASELLRRKGLSWTAFIPIERDEAGAPSDWPVQATRFIDHPALTSDERAYVKRVSVWRAPGADCLARLQAIADRLGVG